MELSSVDTQTAHPQKSFIFISEMPITPRARDSLHMLLIVRSMILCHMKTMSLSLRARNFYLQQYGLLIRLRRRIQLTIPRTFKARYVPYDGKFQISYVNFLHFLREVKYESLSHAFLVHFLKPQPNSRDTYVYIQLSTTMQV